jgi:hypothetical protein
MLGGLWLAITAFGLALRPSPEGHGTHQELGFPPCPSVLLFDRPCPGCGLTTSFTRLLHLDIPGAFQAHQLGPALYLALAASGVVALIGFFRGVRVGVHTPKAQAALIGLTLTFLAFGVWRFATTRHYQTARERSFVASLNGLKPR